MVISLHKEIIFAPSSLSLSPLLLLFFSPSLPENNAPSPIAYHRQERLVIHSQSSARKLDRVLRTISFTHLHWFALCYQPLFLPPNSIGSTLDIGIVEHYVF